MKIRLRSLLFVLLLPLILILIYFSWISVYGNYQETKKLDYGDVVVFPSIIPHRVRPIKSGKRYSLVGWYGGPPFK